MKGRVCCLSVSPPAPDAPENFTVSVIDSQSVRATWDNPLDSNGIILNFSLTLQLAPDQGYLPQPAQTEFELNSTTFELMILGLHPFATYDFILRAATSFGEGNETNTFATTDEAGICVLIYFHTQQYVTNRQCIMYYTFP